MKKLGVIFLFPLLTLVSCSSDKNKLVLPINEDYSDAHELNGKQVISLIDAKIPFVLLSYSPYCSACKKADENIKKYVEKYHTLLYKFDITDSNEYKKLYDFNETYFPEIAVTPRLLLFNKEGVMKEINQGRLGDYNMFSSSLNTFTKTNRKLHFVSTLTSYQKVKEDIGDITELIYDSSLIESTSLYLELISQKNIDKDYLVIDKKIATQELVSYLEQ